MKKITKTLMAGLLSLGSTVCAAQDLTVNQATSYTIPSVEAVAGATYKWIENGVEIAGATAASYTNSAGKPAGTYVYVRMAYTAACGWQNSNAFIVYVSAGTTPLYAASTRTWSYGGLTWSDVIRLPSCNKSSLTTSYMIPDCRSYTSGSNVYYYYNWPYVYQNVTTLCPSPWSVPTRTDMNKLVSALAGSSNLVAVWGYGGQFTANNTPFNVTIGHRLWTLTSTQSQAYDLCAEPSLCWDSRLDEAREAKQIRCVK